MPLDYKIVWLCMYLLHFILIKKVSEQRQIVALKQKLAAQSTYGRHLNYNGIFTPYFGCDKIDSQFDMTLLYSLFDKYIPFGNYSFNWYVDVFFYFIVIVDKKMTKTINIYVNIMQLYIILHLLLLKIFTNEFK